MTTMVRTFSRLRIPLPRLPGGLDFEMLGPVAPWHFKM